MLEGISLDDREKKNEEKKKDLLDFNRLQEGEKVIEKIKGKRRPLFSSQWALRSHRYEGLENPLGNWGGVPVRKR